MHVYNKQAVTHNWKESLTRGGRGGFGELGRHVPGKIKKTWPGSSVDRTVSCRIDFL